MCQSKVGELVITPSGLSWTCKFAFDVFDHDALAGGVMDDIVHRRHEAPLFELDFGDLDASNAGL